MPGNMRQGFDVPIVHNTTSNGTRSKKQASSTNGHTNNHARGAEMSNGHGNGTKSSFFGHDRQELARLLIQGLQDLGYDESAETLIHESGYELESPTVAAFRHSVLNGEWSEAESLLFGTNSSIHAQLGNGDSRQLGLPLADGVNEHDLRFLLRQQKYLELLEARDHAGALMVLRQELTPLHRDTGQLHNLSGLMVCPTAEDLRTQAVWDGAQGYSRRSLLEQLSKAISPSIMIPSHRLATLLSQVKSYQVSKCYYHNPLSKMSLFTDHTCDKHQFPLRTIQELSLKDEVWFVQFSHDGKWLAAAGSMLDIAIYETDTWRQVFSLKDHRDFVAFLAWSPDDSRLISCSNDKTAKIWNMYTGRVAHTIDGQNEPITAAAWTPDGNHVVTGSMDPRDSIYQWTPNAVHVHAWPSDYRVIALAISPDGSRLVVLSTNSQVHVYDFHSRTEVISVKLNLQPTCVSISRDSNFMLINMAENELQLIDIKSAGVVERFLGQKQTKFVIRSTFSHEESLVITGSEDGIVYIFNKERGILLEKLVGHTGMVNSISWNPAHACMFASGGDDSKIRIWSKPSVSVSLQIPSTTSQSSHQEYRTSITL